MAKIIKVEDTDEINRQIDPIVQINEEFEKLLDQPSKEELKELEESLIAEGCRHPIDIWTNYIIDGHSRYKICQKHNIYFKTRKVHFEDEDQAKFWILRNQRDRRNLKEEQKETVDLEIAALEAKGIKRKRTDPCVDAGTRSCQSLILNTQASILANKSKGKLFRYQSVVGEISSEDPQAIKKREAEIFPSYDKLLRIKILETEQENFSKDLYHVIYADFYKKALDSWEPKIFLSKIKNIPMKNFLSKDAVAFLWSPISYLESTLNIMKAWGLYYRTMLTLGNDKASAIVVGSKKKNSLDMKTLTSQLANDRPEGIADIEYFRGVIEEMHPRGNKLQLFIAQKAGGWDKYWKNSV